jgi:hypothetical protein
MNLRRCKNRARNVVLQHPESDCSVHDLDLKAKSIEKSIDELCAAISRGENVETASAALETAMVEQMEIGIRLNHAIDLLAAKMEAMKQIFRKARRIIAHNAIYESQLIMVHYDFDFYLEIYPKMHCSMLLHQAVDPLGPKGLDDCGAALGFRPWKNVIGKFMKTLPKIPGATGKKAHRHGFDKVPLSILLPYNGMDTIVSKASFDRDEADARRRSPEGKVGPWDCYNDHMQQAMVEISIMKRNGMAVDEKMWEVASKKLKGRLDAAETRLYFHHDFLLHYGTQMGIRGKIVDGKFVPESNEVYLEKIKGRFKHRSVAQMSSLLYKTMGWPILGHGKKFPQKHILIGEGDGQKTTFVIKGMRKRGRHLKLVDLDYTYDHSVVLDVGGREVDVKVDRSTRWSATCDEKALFDNIPSNSCRVVKFGYPTRKKHETVRYDCVVFGTPPIKGAKIHVTCLQKAPSVSSDRIGDYISLFKMGQPKFELASCLLELANTRKLYGVYVEPTLRKRSKGDNLIHPKFNPYGTVTGRHSSEWHTLPWDDMLKSMFVSKFRDLPYTYKDSPLLQAYFEKASKTLEGLESLKDAKKIYEMLLRLRGGMIVAADEAQLELRVGAALSNDKELMQIFIDGGLDPNKPEQYAIIERCSPGPYLELFARRRRPGWQVWGNEVDSDVQL